MKIKSLLLVLSFAGSLINAIAQPTVCPAPIPGAPNCFQTSRPANGNPLTNWPPIPNQDCCNAIPLCQPLNEIENGTVIPPNAPAGVLYPGCVNNELPSDANTCFSNNEKGTTWYKFQIRPLPGGPTAPGSPAGKLRFKIIPKDALDDPNYDPATDDGSDDFGDTDYDFLLFKVTAQAGSDGAACNAIKNSSAWNTPGSVIASCNWTGIQGPTGLFEPGTGTESAQAPASRFNKPLSVKVGDVFYLAIDNFTVNIQGFFVDFRGLEAPDDSTAIVNPPPVDSIKIAKILNPKCTIQTFKITFDKPVRCDSVRPDKFLAEGLLPGFNPNINILSIVPDGGCNPGGQDSTFVLTINPFEPGQEIRLTVIADIRDICGNKVLLDTANLKIDALVPLGFKLDTAVSSRGIPKLIVKFSKPVFCDSVKASKFDILYKGSPLGAITDVVRASGVPCTPGALDTMFVLTFSEARVDTANFQLAMVDIIRDECGNPVTFDTLSFRINKFVTILGIRDTVCPDSTVALKVQLDSTFRAYTLNQQFNINYTWRDITKTDTLRASFPTVFFSGSPVPKSQIEIKKDTTVPLGVTYRVYVKNGANGCIDSSDVNVLFSARPSVEQIANQAACFGEELTIKPQILNGRRDQFNYSWKRKAGQPVEVSTDSMLVQNIDSLLTSFGLSQNYGLVVRFADSLGGCVSQENAFQVKYGRRISPKIDLDPSLRFASILPAQFTYGNASSFGPAKTGAKYDWSFGQGESSSTMGNLPVTTTYNDAGTYTVRLTAYDSLFATTTSAPKICSVFDEIQIGTQNLIPSLVTSNGDGINDNFYIEGMRENTFSMKLYNRWGKLVGEQDPFKVDVNEEGRGGFDPKDIEGGIYYYILTEKRSGKNLVGWITLSKDKK